MEGEAQTSTESTPVTTTEAPAAAPTETAQPAVETTQTSTEQTEGKPSGFDPVEFTPEQKARMDRVYGNMKRYETKAREMEETNALLAEQVRILNETQSKVITHIQNNDYQDAEAQLKGQRKAAYDRGDIAAVDDVNDRLRDLSVRKALAEMNGQKPQPQIQRQQPQGPVSAQDVINNAVQKGDVTEEEATVYKAWISEADDSGQLKRPWTNQADLRNSTAAFEGRAVFSNPAFANKTFAEKLREIDRRMGIQTQSTNGQNVLPNGNLTRSGKTNNVKLTDYEMKIAEKTKFGGSKAKSIADHHEAYRQAKIKSQQKGATR